MNDKKILKQLLISLIGAGVSFFVVKYLSEKFKVG